ncbi:MAG: twin-arginine translocation signal domain-containing protein [Mesorhizobium sp.]|uniref:twin-arginine translocation signal domain-containing protein n=1 Tax=Mesorhizobium sp. TaxID=1871066 RepID=UPI001216364F|nr:MAG: twin-arginine translocation signal domain-containing protein [Mesorhizobium sp.]TIW74734.1 MAG: twin-arginine translocation signal domain-containing protein [Mesorhizobium sp.]TJV99174.1 MAG: twin-arginine translocation signal domain-containing protein [Mesorhizobium sp.]
MSQQLEYLSRYVAAGRLSRREFLGRATALGVSATFANSILASAARAQGPVRGGITRAALVVLGQPTVSIRRRPRRLYQDRGYDQALSVIARNVSEGTSSAS